MQLTLLLLAVAAILAAQPATFPTTTLAVPLTGWPAAHQPAITVNLISNADLVPGINPISNGVGDPTGHTNQILMIDQEAMCIDGPVTPTGAVPVERGCQGTRVEGHAAGAIVWVGYPSYYASTVPSGICDVHAVQVLPSVYIDNGGVYNCIAGYWQYTGSTSGVTYFRRAAVLQSQPKAWYERMMWWKK